MIPNVAHLFSLDYSPHRQHRPFHRPPYKRHILQIHQRPVIHHQHPSNHLYHHLLVVSRLNRQRYHQRYVSCFITVCSYYLLRSNITYVYVVSYYLMHMLMSFLRIHQQSVPQKIQVKAPQRHPLIIQANHPRNHLLLMIVLGLLFINAGNFLMKVGANKRNLKNA